MKYPLSMGFVLSGYQHYVEIIVPQSMILQGLDNFNYAGQTGRLEGLFIASHLTSSVIEHTLRPLIFLNQVPKILDGFRAAPVPLTYDFINNNSAFIDDNTLWNSGCPIKALYRSTRIYQHGLKADFGRISVLLVHDCSAFNLKCFCRGHFYNM